MTTATPNLDIKHLQPNSDQPEVVVNAGFDGFDARITDAVVVSIGSASPEVVILTQDQQAAGCMFVLQPASPGPTGNFTVNFAAFGMGLFTVFNNTSHTATLQISGQSLAAPTLAAAARGVFQSDGVNIVELVSSGGSTSTTGTLGYVIDGGGAAIATGVTADLGPWAFDLTLTQVTLLADQSGSIALDLWVAAYSAYPPTIANTIVASAPPTISSAVKYQDSGLSGWSKTITAGKTLRINVTSCATIQRCAVALNYTRTV